MSERRAPEARAHHFVPQCWLDGFADSGERDGKLVVTDMGREKQRATTPAHAGHIRDFDRLSGDGLDPLAVEKALSSIEGDIAPLLRSPDQSLRLPTEDELGAFGLYGGSMGKAACV